MKKTVNVNIGGAPFTVDEDAYGMLKKYLNEIEIRLDGVDDKETMQDIEIRIADIFNGAISAQSQVVDAALVKRAIAIIGSAREFGEPRRSLPDQEPGPGPDRQRRLYRSRREKIIGGVCGGIAEYSGIDLTLVRVLMALFIIFGVGLMVYIVMWIFMVFFAGIDYRLFFQCALACLVAMTELNIDNIKAQMRKGILEYCILSIISRNDAYASSIIAELKAAEMIVVEGTLYPLLTRQKNQGLLSYRWEESPQGPPRKYYSITQKGRECLEQLDIAWSELISQIRIIRDGNR